MNGRRVTWRVWLPYALVVGSALLIAYIGGAPDRGGAPLDPTSAAPDGAKALVDTLRALGVRVTVGPGAPNASTTTALLLSDRLVDAQVQPVDDWVRGGGTLVVADPSSRFSITRPTGRTLVGFIEPELERRCDEPALRDVGRVLVPNGQLLRVPKGAFGCFTEGSTSAFLVSAPVGRLPYHARSNSSVAPANSEATPGTVADTSAWYSPAVRPGISSTRPRDARSATSER